LGHARPSVRSPGVLEGAASGAGRGVGGAAGDPGRPVVQSALTVLRQLPGVTALIYDQRCAAENIDHLGFLLQVIELELIERERKAAERRLKAARFPTPKNLDEFDFAARPSVSVSRGARSP